MSLVGFKSDFLVAAARGVMLRTSPSQIRGRGTPWGAVWYPRNLGRRKENGMKIDRKDKGKKYKNTRKIEEIPSEKSGCLIVCDVKLIQLLRHISFCMYQLHSLR
jgi:hypothetical protein